MLLSYLVYLLLLLMPVLLVPVIPLGFELPKLVLFHICTLLMLFLWILRLGREKKVAVYSILKEKMVRRLLMLVLGVLALSTVFSIAPRLSFWGSYFRMMGAYTWFFLLLFFFLLCFNFRKKVQWEKAQLFLFAGFFATLIYGLVQSFGWDLDNVNLQAASLGRIFSTFGHPNYFATYILLLFFPMMAFIQGKKRWWLLAIVLVLSLLMLFLTKSRGAWIGFGVGLIIYLLALGRVHKRRSVVVAAIFVPIVLAILAVSSGRLDLEAENLRSVETRLSIWSATLEMVDERPFLGYGLDTFGIVFQKFADPKLLELEGLNVVPDRAHNTFLGVMAQMGLVGLVVYVMALFWVVKIGLLAFKRVKGEEKIMVVGVMSSFAAVLVSNLFGFAVVTHMVIIAFWLAYLLFLASPSILERKLPKYRLKAWRILTTVFIGLFVLSAIVFDSLFILAADLSAAKGFAAVQSQDANAAVENFRNAVFLNRDQSYYTFILVEILNDLGESELAAGYLEKAGVFSSFQDPFYYLMRGKVLGEEKSFKKAQELAPTYVSTLLNWGIVLKEKGECERALVKFDEYLELVPDVWKNGDSEEKRLFYKHNPDFDEVFNYIEECKG